MSSYATVDFPGSTSDKESGCQCRRCKRHRFDPWVGKIPWKRKWQPTPVFLPGKFREKRSLVGYSPWGHKESDVLMPHYHSPCVCILSCFSRVWLFCDPVDCSLPVSSVHGIFQARILEWVAISFSRGSSQPRDRTHVSYVSWIGGRSFTTH